MVYCEQYSRIKKWNLACPETTKNKRKKNEIWKLERWKSHKYCTTNNVCYVLFLIFLFLSLIQWTLQFFLNQKKTFSQSVVFCVLYLLAWFLIIMFDYLQLYFLFIHKIRTNLKSIYCNNVMFLFLSKKKVKFVVHFVVDVILLLLQKREDDCWNLFLNSTRRVTWWIVQNIVQSSQQCPLSLSAAAAWLPIITITFPFLSDDIKMRSVKNRVIKNSLFCELLLTV